MERNTKKEDYVPEASAYRAKILDALLLQCRSSALFFEVDLLSFPYIEPNEHNVMD